MIQANNPPVACVITNFAMCAVENGVNVIALSGTKHVSGSVVGHPINDASCLASQ